MNWDVTERSANSNIESSPLTITGIKEKKIDSWDCYSIEVGEDITYWKKFGVEKTTKKEIIIFRNTYKNRNLLSDDKNNAFYYFAYHYRKKASTRVPLEGYWFNKDFVKGSAETVFCLSEKANKIIKEEKKRWDDAGLTEAKDLKIENVEFVNAKSDALEKDVDGNNWNPSLNGDEKKLINDAQTTREVQTAQRKIALLRQQKEQSSNVAEEFKKQSLDILNARLANFRTNLGIREDELQAKYAPNNYQSILNKSLTLNNLEQSENALRAVICICATEIANNAGEKTKSNEIRVLLNNLNLIKNAWGQTASKISKENNPLYLEIINQHSTKRQQVENLIQKLQQQQQPQQPQTSLDEVLDGVIKKAKNAKSISELETAINSLDFYRNSQDEETKNIYEQRKQEVDDLRSLLALKLQINQQVENALDIAQDDKDAEEDIFEKRRLVRVDLENFTESTSPEAKQAYQEVNQDGKVTSCIEKLAEKLWNYLKENEKKANDPANREFLQALISNGYTEGTEKYKLYWILQKFLEEFSKARLERKKHNFYPYVEKQGINGRTGWKPGKRGEEFNFWIDFKKPELQILATTAHEISHNVVQLKEYKKLLPGSQSHSKSFWESYYINSDSTLAYLFSCLSSEKQKELKNITNLLSNPDVSNFHVAYCLETGKLEGKARIKKYFKEEEVTGEWRSTRQLVLDINNASMSENLKNWESENRPEADKRWVKAWALHKSSYPSEEDIEEGKQEYKVYIFFDKENAPDKYKETIKEAFSPEKGWEWKKKAEDIDEEVEIISADKVKKPRIAKMEGIIIKCDSGEEKIQQEAKIIDNPPPMVKPNK